MSRRRRVLAVALVLIALLCVASFRTFLAEVIVFRAELQEQRWAKGRAVQSVAQWREVERKVKIALFLAPSHPDYLALLGRLGGWFPAEAADSTELDAVVHQSSDAFRNALKTSPYWSIGWSEFALFKARVGALDDEFSFAFAAARKTGPYEEQAILNLLLAGMSTWKTLTPKMRRDINDLFIFAMQRPAQSTLQLPKKALAMAKEYHMLNEFCELYPDQKCFAKAG